MKRMEWSSVGAVRRGLRGSLFKYYKIGFRKRETETITEEPDGHRVDGGLEDSVGTVELLDFKWILRSLTKRIC